MKSLDKRFGLTMAFAVAALFLFSSPATTEAQKDLPQNQQTQQIQQNRQTQKAQLNQQARQNRENVDYNLRVNDWVWVGYDWDRDGRIDYGEYLATYDLQRARQMSQKRSQKQSMQMSREKGMAGPQGRRMMMHGQGMMMQGQGAMMQGQMGRRMQASDMRTISGNIQSVKKTKFVGMDQPHLIARVQTRQGRTARVDLGPVGNLQNVNLRKGDQVTIQGRRGTVNEKGVLMADMVRTDGQRINVRRAGDLNMKRYSGEIVKIKTASLKSFKAPEQVFARVKLDQGPVTAVHLGPKNKLKGNEVQNLQGKEITFLAHKAQIGNRTALVADQVRVDNRTINIDWASKAAAKRAGQDGGQAQQQERMMRQGQQRAW